MPSRFVTTSLVTKRAGIAARFDTLVTKHAVVTKYAVVTKHAVVTKRATTRIPSEFLTTRLRGQSSGPWWYCHIPDWKLEVARAALVREHQLN